MADLGTCLCNFHYRFARNPHRLVTKDWFWTSCSWKISHQGPTAFVRVSFWWVLLLEGCWRLIPFLALEWRAIEVSQALFLPQFVKFRVQSLDFSWQPWALFLSIEMKSVSWILVFTQQSLWLHLGLFLFLEPFQKSFLFMLISAQKCSFPWVSIDSLIFLFRWVSTLRLS